MNEYPKRMNEYPTRVTGSNIILPDRELSPTEERSGPGWSWMAVRSPWSSSSPVGKFRWAVFSNSRLALADLQQFLDECDTDLDLAEDLDKAAAALRNSAIKQLVLLCSWGAFSVYEVGPGQSGPLAGAVFYNAWVAMMQNDAATMLATRGAVTDGRPVIMYP